MTGIQIAMGLVAAGALTATLPATAQEIPKVLEIGSSAPDFSLKGIDGKTYTLSSFADAKVLCLIFTCNHCPDSVAAAGRIEGVYEDYKDKGVQVVTVNGNNANSLRPDELGYSPYTDSFEEMSLFAKDYGWTFPYLYDGEKQELVSACGGQSTPHVFIFDQDRKLRYTGRMDDAQRNPGAVDKSYIRDALDAVLAGEEVKEKVTRSFGCSTKWLFKVGDVAKDQKNWESKEVTLEEMDEALAKKIRANATNNIRLVNFWSTTCGPCIIEFPDLVETYRRFQNREVEFISITMDPADKKASAEKFLKGKHAALADANVKSLKADGRTSNNYIWTGGNPDKVADAIDPEWTGALPDTVILAPGGEILWRHSGALDIVEMRKALIKALEGRP
ncbi:redoxin domain-containing protein [Luteolibacter pohnpeiensis]|uniref:Redoxin domain-containing protein n=1 Tax=Luteolibacter pohnpeiensis TaxID=454153 RepID=A0A934S8L3_9BACT|nr:redoxin domain-containing protein [Luteolibacter pohnpeiensis]MBK1880833.1 redoxin domain-containing protein [Luteolibacter pohnpeiensis]